MKKNKFAILSIALISSLSMCSCSRPSRNTSANVSSTADSSDFYNELNGQWSAVLDDNDDIELYYDAGNDKLFISSESRGYLYHELDSFTLDGITLKFQLDHLSTYEYYSLELSGTTLDGYVEFAGNKENISFKQENSVNRVINSATSEWQPKSLLVKRLNDYSTFSKDNMDYSFTYQLDERDKYSDFIKKYNLDQITKDKTDFELMDSLLNWVCDNCNHAPYGTSADSNDIEKLLDCAQKGEGLNCRELSQVLSQLLRAYGVYARPVTCLPYDDIFEDCHVIVEAYSKEHNSWIMLDPTYNLYLTTEDGTFIDVFSLRKYIVDGTTLVANPAASYNESDFSLDNYLEYMSKNTFRFFTPAVFDYDSTVTNYDKTIYISLVPDRYDTPRKEDLTIVTTDADKFFAFPE